MERTEESRINDFVIKIATVNGTGSASANGLLMKSIFRMGVPVVGKNYFPSNIQGLPTWYEIRVNEAGFLGRSGRVDVMVAMNAETYRQDLADLSPGGVFIYDSSWPRQRELARDDVSVIGVPFATMCNDAFDEPRTRILMKNIACLGALVALLGVDDEVMRGLIEEVYGQKPKLIEANMRALDLGREYALANVACPLPTRLRAADATGDSILIDGNTAAALGCVYAGATVGAWYPITPSTSLMDAFKSFCERFRKDPETGARSYMLLQAEDELSAIGMAVGAGWSGARAFTSTSGPGVSLMSEFLGYAYFTEIPLVLFDVQRVGPSTGMPTRTQQSDLLACAHASHGDTRHVLLFPADPAECFSLAVTAFDLAETLQTPVIVMSDLDIGMNDWMVPALNWEDDYRPSRGKVLSADEIAALEAFHRYADVDGDGIPRRTLPGTHEKGAYFTRGSGHNPAAGYTEDAEEYQRLVDRLDAKWATAAQAVPASVRTDAATPTRRGLITIGSGHEGAREALDALARNGVPIDYLRIRAFPFDEATRQFLREHDEVFVLEQNRDGQLRSLLLIETGAAQEKLVSLRHYNGLPLSSAFVLDAVSDHIRESEAA